MKTSQQWAKEVVEAYNDFQAADKQLNIARRRLEALQETLRLRIGTVLGHKAMADLAKFLQEEET